jgi:competence protein ComEC
LHRGTAVRVPAALLAIPLLAGASAGVLLFDGIPDRLILVSAFAALLAALAAAGFFAADELLAALACVALGSLLAGYSMAAASTRELLSPSLLSWFDSLAGETGEPVVLEGTLRDDAPLFEYGAALTLNVDSAAPVGAAPLRRRGGVRLIVGGDPPRESVSEWRAGRRVRVTAILRYPASFSNPGVPDERRQLALRGVVLSGTIKSASLIEVVASGSILEEGAAAARAWTRAVIADHVGRVDARSAAVATAILIGDRTGLSEDDERRLQLAGTYHVIAISGGNIAILTALLVFGARAIRVPYRVAALVSILILLFYGQVAGGSASVSRAITAAVVFLTALVLDHRGATLNVVAVAATIAIASSPVATFDGGFLLSFGATTGIILGVPIMLPDATQTGSRGARRLLRATGRAAAAVACATLCAEIALAPIAATLFSRVTIAGLLLNFAAIPLMTAVQCGSMALIAAAPLSARLADATGWFVHWNAWALVESASAVDLMPWAARDVPPPALWVCAVYYAAAIAFLVAPRYRRFWSLVMFATGAAIFFGQGGTGEGVPAPGPGALRVVVMDVGQGDATLAVLPDGRALLVDAGGLAGTTFDMGRRVILPVIRTLGVRELHAFVLTHGDPDHIGGAPEVLRTLRVAHVWEGVPVPPNPLLRDLAQLAQARQVVWRTVRPGDIERAGPIEIRVHHPPEPDWERQRVRNDDSVVLELRYGEVSILLPGDIEREGEQRLLRTLSLAPLVVLKAPHHGSATSSSDGFIEATHPRAVIFSAGRNNRFGHPAPVVVERFRRREIEMFNTADDGAVFVETDGRRVEVTGWKTKKARIAYANYEPATRR